MFQTQNVQRDIHQNESYCFKTSLQVFRSWPICKQTQRNSKPQSAQSDIIYSPPLLVNILFFHLWGSGLRSWLLCLTPHIHSSQRRRNPHTARDCSLGRILGGRKNAGGQGVDTARGWLWTHQWALNGRIPCNFGPSPTWPWPLPCTELTLQWTLKSCSPKFLFTFFPIYSQAPQLNSFP